MRTEVLDEAYTRLHEMGPEFDGDEEGNNGLSNHGPMVAEVLVRRGFDDNVPRWVDRYLTRLEGVRGPDEEITDANWRSALGDGRRLGDWVAYFSHSLAEQPWRDVLITWWPRLLPGIAASATHGVIRVGHAVRTLSGGDESAPAVAELAHGLAFWAGRSRTVPGVQALAGDLSPAAALGGVPHLTDQSGVIAARLPKLGDLAGWSPAVSALHAPVDADDARSVLVDLITATTLRYLRRGHGSPVLLVHTATAPNAVLHTLPELPRELWIPSVSAAWAAAAAIIAAYEPSADSPAGVRPAVPDMDDPATEILERAAAHGDEHVIKFADTAVDVYRRTGDPDALSAALHVGQLIGQR